MSYHKSAISQRPDGQYQRTVGKAYNAQGQLKPKRFILGKDRQKAEAANVLLERLWALAATEFDRDRQDTLQTIDRGIEILRSPNDPTPLTRDEVEDQPVHWTSEMLEVADAARRGQITAHIARESWESPTQYVARLDKLRLQLPCFHIKATDSDQAAASAGLRSYTASTKQKAIEAEEDARIAQTTVPRQLGLTLHAAFDAYASKVRNAKESGKVEAASAMRLKNAIEDMDLGEFGYSAVERIKSYWASRPIAKLRGGKSTGRPIAITTVDNHLSTARRFVRWLDRSETYPWQMPRYCLDALKINRQQLISETEISKLKSGVRVFDTDQLVIIWTFATDFERFLILLGLNAAMSHAEIISLRTDEVDESSNTIKRIRRKSSVYGEFVMWPETQTAFAWWTGIRPPPGDRLLTTNRGQPYTRQRIANQWAALKDRIERESGLAMDWWLPFKHLRKTAAQLVRHAADGEIAGIFLSHGQPVQSDFLSDLYSSRPFHKVEQALNVVHEQLEPMFASVDDVFMSEHIGRRRPRRIANAR